MTLRASYTAPLERAERPGNSSYRQYGGKASPAKVVMLILG
jgi:hypothetical protein